MKKIAFIGMLFLLLVSLAGSALADDDDDDDDDRKVYSSSSNKPSLIDTAILVNTVGQYAGSFDILVAALVVEERLLRQLDRRAPYTVFAPTDDAFLALFDELGVTPEQVLTDKRLLRDVLRYHVIRGAEDASEVTTTSSYRTLSRDRFSVDGTVITDENGREANIIITDVEARNGFIHVIDKVILPR